MKRLPSFLILLFLFSALAPLAAQTGGDGETGEMTREAGVEGSDEDRGYSILQALFLPPRYYVGDRVELRLRILPVEDQKVKVPGELPRTDFLEVHSVSVKQVGREYQASIIFSPYSPGRMEIPPLPMGDLSVQGLRIKTASLVEEEGYQQIQETREQIAVPSTRFLTALGITLLVALPLLGVVLFRLGRGQFRRIQVWYQETRPRRQMIRHLRNLKARVLETERREFYSQLSMGMRRYFTLKLGLDCNSATTRELSGLLGGYLPTDLNREFMEIFLVADQVKFASQYASVEEQVGHLRQCLKGVLALEGKESQHVDL